MKQTERKIRQSIIDSCLKMNATGINQGTSGNISVRYEGRLLITPSGIPYEALESKMIASMLLEGDYGAWEGPLKPSSEWRFHLDIVRSRPEVGAVVHAHPPYCTTLAIARKEIPACHYMVAAFGGDNVRCSNFEVYGTEALSVTLLEALEGRTACLLANHGSIAVGENLAKAMWRAVELETIARQYYQSLSIGGPILLSEQNIADTAKGFKTYGLQDDKTKGAAGKKSSKKKKTTRKTAK